jgi:hypothetical protein
VAGRRPACGFVGSGPPSGVAPVAAAAARSRQAEAYAASARGHRAADRAVADAVGAALDAARSAGRAVVALVDLRRWDVDGLETVVRDIGREQAEILALLDRALLAAQRLDAGLDRAVAGAVDDGTGRTPAGAGDHEHPGHRRMPPARRHDQGGDEGWSRLGESNPRPTHYEAAPAPSGPVHRGPDALVAALMRRAPTRPDDSELQPRLQPL